MDAAVTFADDVARWHDFYLMMGTAAATLLGLLFVAVSLHQELLRDFEGLARQTFRNFIVILLVALVFLVPGQTRSGLGLPLVSFGIVGFVTEFRFRRQLRRGQIGGEHSRALVSGWRFSVSLASYALLIGVALELLLTQRRDFSLLVWVNLGLLTSAAVGSWRMLVVLALRRQPPGGPDA